MKLTNALQSAQRSVVISESFVSFLVLISILPIVYVTVKLISQNNVSHSILVALIASLPRQIQVLTTFKIFFQTLSSYMAFQARFSTLENEAILKPMSLVDKIQLSKIRLNKKVFPSVEHILHEISLLKSGRIQIQGDNGVGKSTLLLQLNENLKDSIYVPAQPLFLNEQYTEFTGSTGQMIKQTLLMIKNEDCSVVLLDEWNAHLDQKNINELNRMIDKLAENKLVIEVLHNKK